jgi:hypothetical protein
MLKFIIELILLKMFNKETEKFLESRRNKNLRTY